MASAGKTLVELFGLARELNVDAEGIEIGPSPQEADHIAAFALPILSKLANHRPHYCQGNGHLQTTENSWQGLRQADFEERLQASGTHRSGQVQHVGFNRLEAHDG